MKKEEADTFIRLLTVLLGEAGKHEPCYVSESFLLYRKCVYPMVYGLGL